MNKLYSIQEKGMLNSRVSCKGPREARIQQQAREPV